MNINIRGENIAMTTSLQDYAEKRIGKLEKYFSLPLATDARVNMRVHNKEQVIEVTIPMQGLLLRAEVGQEDMYTAIDMVVSKLERQIKKYKTKVNRKSRQDIRQVRQESGGTVVTKTIEAETPEESQDVVRRKRFVFKPMTVEEAILQMDMLGHSFFVFNNADSGATNVVYRRRDGRYGLIDQE
ncbi:ribosome hibernation-promoting factor, HPF/YfiA family [Sporolactobacillus putidus]|uniref:Ribosome hibernation promoting factor n=1 Tax=Sporolactobacillus putidus TaxID=492735 RepID=A0A917W117_9BACL|nr:ribosome-associated translation inhibitor RaiA [Sporolactobacillus putidus]GGL54410.1 ribosome hibernation promotion factor [Sporolactobacillus putidus]